MDSNQFEIIKSFENEARERYDNVRFEDVTSPDKHQQAAVFFSKSRDGVVVYKLGFIIKVVDDLVIITPGSLLNRLLYENQLTFELADPISIDKIWGLFEDCRE